MQILNVETSTHGRVLVSNEDAADSVRGTLVAFHGYGRTAEDALAAVQGIPGARSWRIVAVQALHCFYTRGAGERRGAMGPPRASPQGGVQGAPPIKDDHKVGASWMTRQDRELAIADNVAYIDKVVDLVVARDRRPRGGGAMILAGFSQGAAMAYRAATLGRHQSAGVIALAGDIPPELKDRSSIVFPPVLIGVGRDDTWFTEAKADADAAFLASRRIPHEVVRYAGGHEWTTEFKEAAGKWLSARAESP